MRHSLEDLDSRSLATLSRDRDLPPRSRIACVLRLSSYLLWRVRDVAPSKSSSCRGRARELLTDRAATSCTQTTEVAGIFQSQRVHVGIESPLARRLRGEDPAVGAGQLHPPRLTEARRPLRHALVDARGTVSHAWIPVRRTSQGDLRTFVFAVESCADFNLSTNEAVRALERVDARCEPP